MDQVERALLVASGDAASGKLVADSHVRHRCCTICFFPVLRVLIGLLYKAYPNDCQHSYKVVLRPRPYPMRRHRLLYLFLFLPPIVWCLVAWTKVSCCLTNDLIRAVFADSHGGLSGAVVFPCVWHRCSSMSGCWGGHSTHRLMQ